MKIQIKISSTIRIQGPLDPELEEFLKRRLTIVNPVWLENQKFGRYNYGVKKHLHYYWKRGDVTSMPRGFARQLLTWLSRSGLDYEMVDQTRELPEVQFGFMGELYGFQQEAAQRILSRRFGVARMPTGAGKTILALYCISERAQPAVVIVHTKELLYQWKERALDFLDIREQDIGLVGDGKKQFDRNLTICVVNSLYKCAAQMKKKTGHLIVDECHRIPSRSFTVAVKAFDSKYMLGLSATPFRRDGLTPLIPMYIGDSVCEVNAMDLQDKGKISRAKLVVRKTNFDYPYEDDYHQMISTLVDDGDRNRLIASDAVKFQCEGSGTALVVSDRKSHCRKLAALMADKGARVGVLTGDLADIKRKDIVRRVNEGEVDILVATIQLIGEGFDCPSLSALFMATPVKFTGRVLQVVGRVLRAQKGKEQAAVFDYVDKPGVLQASFQSRMEAYRQLGLKGQSPLRFCS
ncbi:type III restriction protein res subunit [Desulfatibacillum aliphaticivorans]|uniref:Type III restriction protein res subunit n=1 Tax=Desulfatibacillum aliphaticivorans TaxID=218208 RepID=B8FJ56_DESAL|nr:DEAD/DEAH box helicase [Desulfatibacillum aliphaticivorans]ACL04983.1 type III restriction protein res subunit [Desulfatibacillum aliphaticivorans]